MDTDDSSLWPQNQSLDGLNILDELGRQLHEVKRQLMYYQMRNDKKIDILAQNINGLLNNVDMLNKTLQSLFSISNGSISSSLKTPAFFDEYERPSGGDIQLKQVKEMQATKNQRKRTHAKDSEKMNNRDHVPAFEICDKHPSYLKELVTSSDCNSPSESSRRDDLSNVSAIPRFEENSNNRFHQGNADNKGSHSTNGGHYSNTNQTKLRRRENQNETEVHIFDTVLKDKNVAPKITLSSYPEHRIGIDLGSNLTEKYDAKTVNDSTITNCDSLLARESAFTSISSLNSPILENFKVLKGKRDSSIRGNRLQKDSPLLNIVSLERTEPVCTATRQPLDYAEIDMISTDITPCEDNGSKLEKTSFKKVFSAQPTEKSSSFKDYSGKQNSIPQYRLEKSLKTVGEIWKEYAYGDNSKPPLRELERKYGARWRNETELRTFLRRKKIYDAIETGMKKGFIESKIINELESWRTFSKQGVLKTKPLLWLYLNIPGKFTD